MKKVRFFFTLALFASALFAIPACRDREVNDDAAESDIASNNALADNVFEDLNNLADEASNLSSGSKMGRVDASARVMGQCATVTKNTVSNNEVLTIDFGTTNCAGPEGRNRRGKVIVTYKAPYGQANNTVTIVPENYFVNDHKVEGTRTSVVNGSSAAGNPLAQITGDLTITLAGGGQIKYNATRTREWTAGSSTLEVVTDDVFKYNGTSTVTGPRGFVYATTAQDLVRSRSCRQFTAGKLVHTRQGNQQRGVTVDFGTGACDDTAVVTLFSGRVITLQLP